jgi:glyceraldehyde-3-phosphate dehydrogenase/erythrose-4-phosphate dehydrogenase
MIRVALNGFGRTARTFFRIVHKDPQIEIVAINVRSQTPEQAAYLCKYDSVYGRLDGAGAASAKIISLVRRQKDPALADRRSQRSSPGENSK